MATLAIKFAVGRDGRNRPIDTEVVQKLLNAALQRDPKLRLAGIERLTEDGDCGPLTVAAIRAYQERVLGWSGPSVDSTVHPNRTTWKSLNGNVSSIQKIKTQQISGPAETAEGYKSFKQGDSQWASQKLGSGDLTIWGAGCAMCTLAMAATAIGSPTRYWPKDLLPRNLTPPKVNEILRKSGAFSGSSLTMSTAANALGMDYEEYGRITDTKPEDFTKIHLHLCQGSPVAAHVDYKGGRHGDHWILIVRRYSDGTYGAIDPSYGAEMRLTASPQCVAGGARLERDMNIERAVLFGHGMGGTAHQNQYVVVRFALLSPASGAFFP